MHRFLLPSAVLALVLASGASPTGADGSPAVLSEYGGWPQIRSKATGFFRVQEFNRKWWVIDPAGNGFLAIGTDHVNYTVHFCEALGYAPYSKNVKAKFNDNEGAWAASAVERLKNWGFNLLGANNSPSTRGRGMAYTEFLGMGMEFAAKDGLVKRTGWTGFPNVFNPDFEKSCEEIAAAKCAPLKSDPWLFGYFIDNELEWFGKSGSPVGLAEEAIKRPAGDSAKKAFIEILKAKYESPDKLNDAWSLNISSWDDLDKSTDWNRSSKQAAADKREFVRLAAEKYFAITAAAIRKADPNHMILGCRFAGVAPDVVDIAGKYCDIVSLNRYGQVNLEKEEAVGLADDLAKWYGEAGRPIMITEWSFPALDTPLPSKHGAGQRVATQKDRALAYEVYQKKLFSLPFVVGSNYFMWVDEPALGISKSFPEDSNYGLVDVDDNPYPDLTRTASRVNRLAYEIHSGQTVEVSVDPKGTGMRDGLVAFIVSGTGGKLPATVEIRAQVDDKKFETKAQVVAGPRLTVPLETNLGPGAHRVIIELDPDRKLVQADRSGNRLETMVYQMPSGWKQAGQYDMTFRVPIGVHSASPTASRQTVVVPMAPLGAFRYGRTLTVQNIRLEDREGRPAYFEIFDMDSNNMPSDGDDLVFQATVGGGRTETYYLWVGRSSDFAEPTGKFLRGQLRSEIHLDNGKLKLKKTTQSGTAIESVSLGKTELGSFEILISQQNGGISWIRPNKLHEILLLEGDLLTRVIVRCRYAPEDAGTEQGGYAYMARYAFELEPDKPWFGAQFRNVENIDTEPWTLVDYFYYPQAVLETSAKEVELAELGAPNAAGWRNPKTGAIYGLIAFPPASPKMWVTFWKDDAGGQHSDAHVEVKTLLTPGKQFGQPGPWVYLFGAVAKGDEKPAVIIRRELLQRPAFQQFAPEVKAEGT